MNETNQSEIDLEDQNIDEYKNLRTTAAFIIEGVLLPILATFGIVGNLLCVWTFNKKDVELKPSFANLLKCLSIFDTVFLVCILLQYSLPTLSEEYYIWVLPYITPYTLPIIHISLTGSVYSVVAVAVERFITVCFPFQQCQMWNGLGYIIPIILFSILYNLVKFFEIETIYLTHEEWVTYDNGTNISTTIIYPWLNATNLRRDPAYSEYVVFVLNFIVMGLLPVLLLSGLNFLIYRSISRATATHNNISSAHRRDNTMARLLMAIVIVFLSCHSTKIIVNFYEALQMVRFGTLSEHPGWIMLLVKVNHLLLTINSAINIVIYSYKDFKFRSVLFSAFRRKKSFTSFRTSMRSSFGSTRYRSRFNSRVNGNSLYNQHSSSNSDQARTVETSLKDSLMESTSSRNFVVENGVSVKHTCDIQPCVVDTITHV